MEWVARRLGFRGDVEEANPEEEEQEEEEEEEEEVDEEDEDEAGVDDELDVRHQHSGDGQWAATVVNFSTQYGTDGSNSYTARNIAGSLRIYPKYGDFVDAFVLRTYGPWWQCCPSAAQKLRKASEHFISQDFVELQYMTPMIPSSIEIFETYHPGAVVRILACNADPTTKPGEVRWVTLWSGPPQCNDVPKKSRIFAPPLKKIDFPTSLIRLEFNSEQCGYYTELDGVKMKGELPQVSHEKTDRAVGFQLTVTDRLLRQLSLSDRQASVGSFDEDDFDKWGYFSLLPDEIIQHIFGYLDIVSLSSVAQTCSILLKNAYDPFLYETLDLQSHWDTVDNVVLESLAQRCHSIKHLNLSWTGGGGQMTEQALCRFLEDCGSELRTLHLACCRYVGNMTLVTIGQMCPQLEDLDLQCCTQLKDDTMLLIGNLSQLRRLNLYSMNISAKLLETIGRKCPLLEHFNIGASIVTLNLPTNSLTSSLNECLGKLKNLVSLDLWRCKHATSTTIQTLADCCPNLEELDIGWCHTIYRVGFDIAHFCSNCPKLKKLYFTCGRFMGRRTLDDGYLKAIAKFCPLMEQLDILGTNNVSKEGAVVLLERCPNMVFFDVSFCGRLSEEVMSELTQRFPDVCFKKSFS